MIDSPPIAAPSHDASEKFDLARPEAQQNLPPAPSEPRAMALPAPAVGTELRVRGCCWEVRAVHDFAACRLLALTRLGSARHLPQSLSILLPFDRIAPVAAPGRWCPTGLRTIARELARSIADVAGGGVGHLLGSALELAPWQWTAAFALRRGHASTILLADAVGLGKTVQAGCAVAALGARGDAGRVLILAPAGLRDQWEGELRRLFHLEPTIVDAAWLRRARRDVPADVNPWTTVPAAIASIDFVKQPEVLAAAADAPWDVLILDEAHVLACGSDRRAAAAVLAESSRHVMLLTATPHTGSSEDLAALAALGRVRADEPPMLLVRRTRADVGLDGSRRVRVAHVTLSEAERAMHGRLREYAAAVWRERGSASHLARLAMVVLLKRAASSAWALQRSVAHRLRALAGEEAPSAQPLLPFDDPGETDGADADLPAALGAPGLDERGRELDLLGRVSDAARLATESESKLARVATLLRRTPEPALVFTEYRDTLERAARVLNELGPLAVLHGGLSRAERGAAERAFTSGAARVLLATDVASEGLNLQGRCRLAINLELPWNPNRLEQRIGRVDRIGQHRRVHAAIVVGRSTAESYVLGRLAARARSIRRFLGEGGAAAALADTLLAAGALGERLEGSGALDTGCDAAADAGPDADGTFARPSADASHEAGLFELLWHARQLQRVSRPASPRAGARRQLPMAVLAPRRRSRLALTPGAVLVFRVDALTSGGRSAAATAVAVHVAIEPSAISRAPARSIVAAVLAAAAAAGRREGARLLARDLEAHRGYVARAAAREAALLARAEAGAGRQAALVQPGLFDRRAVNDAARRQASVGRRRDCHAARLAQLAADAHVSPRLRVEPVCALVLR